MEMSTRSSEHTAPMRQHRRRTKGVSGERLGGVVGGDGLSELDSPAASGASTLVLPLMPVPALLALAAMRLERAATNFDGCIGAMEKAVVLRIRANKQINRMPIVLMQPVVSECRVCDARARMESIDETPLHLRCPSFGRVGDAVSFASLVM